MSVIEAKHLTKYDGKARGIIDVSLPLASSSVAP